MPFNFNTFGTTSQSVAKPKTGSFDLKSFGSPTPAPIAPPKNTRNLAQKTASFLGVEKFGQGIGQALSNREGTQDKLIALHDQSMAIAEQLRSKIKENKVQGKDTSRLQKALDDQLKSNAEFLGTITDVGTGGLTNKEVLGSALNTAALFIPGAPKGSGTLTKASIGAATGYAFDVANKLQQNKSGGDIFKPGIGTALGFSLPVLTSIFGKGAKLEQISERLSPSEKKNLGAKGKEVAQYLVDKRVVGTPEQRLAKVNDLYSTMEDKVQKLVDSSGVAYPRSMLENAINSVPKQFKNNPAEYQNVVSKMEGLVNFLKQNADDYVPAGVVNEYKRTLADAAYNEKGNKVLSEGFKAASDEMYKLLQEDIPKLKPLNKEYSNLITARSLLGTATGRNQAGVFARAAGMLSGGAIGTQLGNYTGGAVGAYLGQGAVNKLATPIRTGTGVALNEVQKLLNKIPVDKVGNLKITQKALIKLLSGH